MEPLSDVTFESIPGCLVITVYNASHSTMNRTHIQIPLYIFLKRLYEPYKTRNVIINLLVFGISGAGKSEFINSCTTAISQVKVPSIALASGSTSMVTNTFRGYRLQPFESEFTLEDDMKSCVVLWDTWGLTDANYVDYEFQLMLKGEMANGTSMTARSGYSIRKAPIHCVIFFLPAYELDPSPPSTLCKRIQPFMEITKRLGIPAILALSLADRLVSDLANFPRYYVQTASSMFSLPETCVFPLVSYYGASIKNSVTDKIILRVLFGSVYMALLNQREDIQRYETNELKNQIESLKDALTRKNEELQRERNKYLLQEEQRIRAEREIGSLTMQLHEQTLGFAHILRHIQQGVWVKSVAPSWGGPQEEASACVMKQVLIILERHNITFPETVCSLCPLDKVVKMGVEKQFGVDENQQVVSFSKQGEISEEAVISGTSSALSQLSSLFPFEGIPEIKVRLTSVMTIKQSDLQYVCNLGRGSYGTVDKAIYTPSGREVAVKTMHEIIASNRNIELFMNEADIVSGLRHPNIVKCIGTSTTRTGQLQIVSELMCCSLGQLLRQKRLSIKEVAAIALNVSKGMESLHRQNFMHRDLSSNNILFDSNGTPKICDFGVSRVMYPQGALTGAATPNKNRTMVPGTHVYMAPQMLTENYSIEGDMWGFGILLSEMMSGDIVDPFDTLPLSAQLSFMNEQKQHLSSPDVEEVNRLCIESSESTIGSCLGRRSASIETVTHLTHSADSPLLLSDGITGTRSAAAGDLIVLVVQSCLSILERNRLPFSVIAKMLLCCTAIILQTTETTAVQVTDDQVNECTRQWLSSLVPSILANTSSS
ncbi:TKL family protein kinase [Pelomyxa schiedti]|nr:TKL family protein kinase [Pelomyxa schiedti]